MISNYELSGAIGVSVIQLRVKDNGGTDNGGVDTSVIKSITIEVNAANVPPDVSVPGPQSTPEETGLVFKASNGNAITVSDADAGANVIEVRLQVLDQVASPNTGAGQGILTLGSTVGILITSGANGSKDMTLRGPISSLNNALEGLTYLPPLNFVSEPFASLEDVIKVTANDLGNTGTRWSEDRRRNGQCGSDRRE